MPLVEEASVLVPPNEMNWPPKLAMAAATAFLVRTCELTEEKAKRLKKWHTTCNQLYARLSPRNKLASGARGESGSSIDGSSSCRDEACWTCPVIVMLSWK